MGFFEGFKEKCFFSRKSEIWQSPQSAIANRGHRKPQWSTRVVVVMALNGRLCAATDTPRKVDRAYDRRGRSPTGGRERSSRPSVH